jgi:hypothetical protein
MRITRSARRAAVALTALGLAAGAVAAATSAQGAVSPGWRVTRVVPATSWVWGVAATGARDAWAVSDPCDSCGADPILVERWNGTAWQSLPAVPSAPAGVLPGGSADAVTASSPSNVWAFENANSGSTDITLAEHWTGRGWAKPAAFPAWADVDTAVTSGPRDAWAFGTQITPSSAFATHYNGAKWTRVSFPLLAQQASGLSAGNVWVVGSWDLGKAPKGASPFAVEHWNGKAWRAVAVPKLTLPKNEFVQAQNVVAEGPDNVWAAGILTEGMGVGPGIVLLHWNGKAFTRVNVPYSVSGGFAVSGDGSGGLWISATQYSKTTYLPYLYHYSGGHWTRFAVPNEPKNQSQIGALTAIPGTHSVWAAGMEMLTSEHGSGTSQGIILKYGP